MFGLKRIFWALRKVNILVGNGLVLDVGSGGRPYPRSDVLLDRLTGHEHRCGEDMFIDGRVALFGDANKMPFKDKAFDFIIASHILEHISQPEVFLEELQRVGKSGYIETPNVIFERFWPHNIHCLEIAEFAGKLVIYKKGKPVEDDFLAGLNLFVSNTSWAKLFNQNPRMFHVRYFWNDNIDYLIINPDVSCDWIESINDEGVAGGVKSSYIKEKKGWREIGQLILNLWFSWRRSRRMKNFNLIEILACPECRGSLTENNSGFYCDFCNCSYEKKLLPDFTAPTGCKK